MKNIIVFLWGVSCIFSVEAAPLSETLQKAFRLQIPKSAHHNLLDKSQKKALDSNDYTNFSGEWYGVCHIKSEDEEDNIPMLIAIQQDDEGSLTYSFFGEDIQYHISVENTDKSEDSEFMRFSYSFANWYNDKTTLLINAISFETSYDANTKVAWNVLSLSERMKWTIEQNNLMIRIMVHAFVNDDIDDFVNIECKFLN